MKLTSDMRNALRRLHANGGNGIITRTGTLLAGGEELIRQMREHLFKGDPRDVAAYCAFLWWHNLSAASVMADPPETEKPTTEVVMEANGIGWAVKQMQDGKRVAREGWNGKGMFLFLVQGSTFKVNRPPLLGIYEEGTEVQYHAHVDMKTAQGYVVPWLCSQADLLATDWQLAE